MYEFDQGSDRTSQRALRLEARQERLGIVANPAQVEIPVLPPRDVWTRWPKLRSARRREDLHDPAPEARLRRDPVLSGQKLAAFMTELRGGPDRLDGWVDGRSSHWVRPRPAARLKWMRGGARLLSAHKLTAHLPVRLAVLLAVLSVVAGVLAWVYLGAD